MPKNRIISSSLKNFGLTILAKNMQEVADVVNKIYELNRREEILNNFINEALNKINIKKNYQSSKKLPPDFRY